MNNRTTYLLILALFIFGGIGWYMSKNTSNSSSSIDIRDRKFAVEDRSEIAKILVAQRSGSKMIFEKKGKDWFVNGSDLVHPNFMINFLDVLSGIELKYIPPRSAYENMMKAIGKVGIKVEVYNEEGDQLKAYQVGGTTAGELGTVFLMDGYAQPYVMELNNFEGSLRGRFLIDNVDQIRDRTVFEYDEDDIKEISVRYPKDSKQSFRIVRDGGNEFILQPFLSDGYVIKGNVKQGAIENYIRAFQDLDAEAYENNHQLRDSISQLLPLAEISVTDKENVTKVVKLHSLIDVFNQDINTRSVGMDKRIERYFANCSWGDFMIVQDLLFHKVLRRYEEFY